MGANMDQDNLTKVEQFKLLTETGPGTPMGMLLRKFWHPVAVSEKLEKGKAQALRVLGEDLTLYRGEGGRPYPAPLHGAAYRRNPGRADSLHVSRLAV
jgi:hypothetical protein